MIDVTCSVDHIRVDEEVEGRVALSPGGQPFVVAAWLAALGAQPTVVGPLSNGASGVLLSALAPKFGIRLEPQLFDGDQGIVLLLRHDDGRSSKVAQPGVGANLTADAIPPGLVDAADGVFVSGYALGRESSRAAALELCRLADRRRLPIFIDLASRIVLSELAEPEWQELVAQAKPTVIFATATETMGLYGAEAALAEAASVVVIKRGRAGATVYHDRARHDRDALPVDLVDASGCGDALAAAFICRWLSGASPTEATQAGIGVAATCAGRFGPLPSSSPGGA